MKENIQRLPLLQAENFSPMGTIFYQQAPKELINQTLERKQGRLNDTGALCIETGRFTGRSPKDKFIVKDSITENLVDWNHFNQPFEAEKFNRLKTKMLSFLAQEEALWVRDAMACADPAYSIKLRVINENPWSNLFAYNMFIRPTEAELKGFVPEWTIVQAPNFKANPTEDGTKGENFAVFSFEQKMILIGGTGYTGEMKKGIFTVLNFLLPTLPSKVLSMHCSANMGRDGDVAVFFGLSGTGKTTLSADPDRKLIGDDEHGWASNAVFNFEGGCYAKTIGLTAAKEPEIFKAIRYGALVENIKFYPNTNAINFEDKTVTENTRVSYPLDFISNALIPSVAGLPTCIFFLTCDAYGVLPPISKLSTPQAMYQFISGYTAKVAGTEEGVIEPTATFSTCFGAPFLPLHPGVYADLLGQKMNEEKVEVWMINTGWIGGAYGIGERINLKYTRAMITAVLNGEMKKANFDIDPVFGFQIPKTCPNVPSALLNPKNTWQDKTAYDTQANRLVQLFNKNFEQYAAQLSETICSAAPKTQG